MLSLICYLLFFSLPFQLRWRVAGGSDEYQSLFFYGTDILVALFILLGAMRIDWRGFITQYQSLLIPAACFSVWLFVSGMSSVEPLRGLWGMLKTLEYLLLFFIVLSLSSRLFYRALGAIIAGGVFQSIIASIQFITQRDIGLRILGENALSPYLPGVAKLMLEGEQLIRAYGTFPHPNVLATFLFIALCALVVVSARPLRSLLLLAYPILTVGLFLTFSRVVIFFGVLALVSWALFFYWERLKPFMSVLLSSIVLCLLILFPYWQSRVTIDVMNDQAVYLRVLYTKTAFEAIRTHPLVGVGLGQFTAFQEPLFAQQGLPAWANQPVHNMYILLSAQAGIPALFFFFWLLFAVGEFAFARRSRWLVMRGSIFLIVLFAFASFDHFFLTFQQGGLIFWFALAFFIWLSRLQNSVTPSPRKSAP